MNSTVRAHASSTSPRQISDFCFMQRPMWRAFSARFIGQALSAGTSISVDRVGTVHDMRVVFLDNDTKLLFCTTSARGDYKVSFSRSALSWLRGTCVVSEDHIMSQLTRREFMGTTAAALIGPEVAAAGEPLEVQATLAGRDGSVTVGGYLATRLEQAGVRHYFVVPGDFNLVLLDQLLTNPRLKMIGCCNELNAGYAADGYPMFGVTRPLARRKSLFSRPPRPHRPQKCSDNASRNRLEFTEKYPCFSEIRRDNGSHVPENRESPLQKRHRQRIRPCRRGLPRRR